MAWKHKEDYSMCLHSDSLFHVMDLSNYLPLCIFHNTLVTWAHFKLPGDLVQPVAFMGFQLPLPWVQQGACWSLFMAFLYSMSPFVWRASCQLGTLTCFAQPVSLAHNFLQRDLSPLFIKTFWRFQAILLPIHQQMLTAHSLLFKGIKSLTLLFMYRN